MTRTTSTRRRLILLHTNDVHGRADGLARVATIVERVRAENPEAAVLYVDAGDVEDSTNRLSNVTKGVAMARLLDAAGCDAAAVGNAAILRYGEGVLEDQAAAVAFPLLLANLRAPDGSVLPGVKPAVLVSVAGVRAGLIGVTAPEVVPGRRIYELAFGLPDLPVEPLVRELAGELRAAGADVVVLISHLGLPDDRALAPRLVAVVDVVIGAHSHDLLPTGERHGSVLVAQAGDYGRHVGRVDLTLVDGGVEEATAIVLPVGDGVPPHRAVLAEAEAVERDVAAYLGEVIGELAEPLEWAPDRECGAAAFMAEVVRERMGADVGVATLGASFTRSLPAGPLRRGTLFEACPSAGNPGAAQMTGAQLRALVVRGLDPARAAETPRPLRGNPQGLLHLSGAEVHGGELWVGGERVEPARRYRVAGSDWELDTYAGYADPAWKLEIEYDVPTIMREAVEEHLARSGPVRAPAPRIHGSLHGAHAA